METQAHTPRPDGWGDLETLLRWIAVLFGAPLKAADALPDKIAQDAARWLRAAEALARALVLVLAQGMTPAPLRPRRPGRGGRRGGGMSGVGLFRTPSTTRGLRRASPLATEAARDDWLLFGGRERARAERAARNAEGLGPRPAAARGAGAPSGPTGPAIRVAASPPGRSRLVARFNGLARLLAAPEPAARRLARRLGRDPRIVARIHAGAHPRRPWRTGFDAAAAQVLAAAPAVADTS